MTTSLGYKQVCKYVHVPQKDTTNTPLSSHAPLQAIGYISERLGFFLAPPSEAIPYNANPDPDPDHRYSDSISLRRSCCSPKSSMERPRTWARAERMTFRKFRCN